MSSLLSIIFLAAIIIWTLKPKNQEEPDEKYISNDDSDYEFWCNYIMLCAIHDTAQQIADEKERKRNEGSGDGGLKTRITISYIKIPHFRDGAIFYGDALAKSQKATLTHLKFVRCSKDRLPRSILNPLSSCIL